MKLSIKIISIFLFASHFCHAQTLEAVEKIFPGSPEASAMAEYAKIPVSHYTGVAEINLPLLELKGKDINIPISISYHSAGNKVNEISSSIGLGWSLNAGGVITRVVRDIYDDHADGYVGSNRRGLKVSNNDFDTWINSEYLNYAAQSWDAEPDIYYFNFMGASGRFTMDADGNVILTPEQDFKIIPAFGPQSEDFGTWTIIDKNGNTYKFGETGDERERSITETTFGISNTSTGVYNSSWFLSSIETPTGEDFDFEYKRGANLEYMNTVEQYGNLSCSTGFGTILSNTEVEQHLTLEKITSRYGYVEISSVSDREDLTGANRITDLKLYNHSGNLIKNAKLNQSYFSSKENCNEPECKRLKLESVDEEYKFEKSIRKYDFDYNATKLPWRDSPEIDHWGYYNANGLSNFISRTAPDDINIHRSPNEIAAQANILKEITYSTGGSTRFEYALNEFRSGQSNIKSGGLRVTTVTDNDNNGSPIVTNYSYFKEDTSISSGVEYTKPLYKNDWLIFQTIFNPDGSTTPSPCGGYRIKSSSLNELFDLNGSNIGYGEVIVQYADGTKEINQYTDLVSNPDIRLTSDYFSWFVNNLPSCGPCGYMIDELDPYGSPYGPPSTRKSYQRGMLVEKVVKDIDGNKTYQLNNTYEEKPFENILSVTGYKFLQLYKFDNYIYDPVQQQSSYAGSDLKFNMSRYTETNGNYRLTQSMEKTFDGNDAYSQITDYTYSFNKPTLLTERTVQLSNGDIAKTEYEYPFELSGTINSLFTGNNQISEYINKRNFINDIQLDYEERIFGYNTEGYFNNGSVPLPKKTNTRKKDLAVYSQLTIDRYDMFGNVLQYHGEDDIPVSILWGYGDRYPVAKVYNATYDDITDDTIGLNINLLNADGPSDVTVRNEISKLRTYAPLSEARITGYTHSPLIGISSSTDSRNYTGYYEYDDFNRLQFVKDDDDNLVSENQYQYVRQFNGNGSSPTQLIVSVTYGSSSNNHQTFISNASGGTNSYEYKWFKGIGTSSTNFESTISGQQATFHLDVSCNTTKWVKLITTSGTLTSTRIIRSNNNPCKDGEGDPNPPQQ